MRAGLVGATMFVHRTLANQVWAYPVGRAGLAVLQHVRTDFDLREMWSFRAAPYRKTRE